MNRATHTCVTALVKDTTKQKGKAMAFFTYKQNNSGGSFVFDPDAGITRSVIIEAESADKANERAESIGLYFDGCEAGRDCDCCGDRWYTASGPGDEVPMYYDTPVDECEGDIANTYAHYMAGRVVQCSSGSGNFDHDFSISAYRGK